MIINNFHILDFLIFPIKANSPLIINSDAVLPSPVAFQLFKPVPGWSEQILQVFGIIDIDQFAPGGALNVFWQFRGYFAKEDIPCFIRSKGFNHTAIVSRRDIIFKYSISKGNFELSR